LSYTIAAPPGCNDAHACRGPPIWCVSKQQLADHRGEGDLGVAERVRVDSGAERMARTMHIWPRVAIAPTYPPQ
jgi:hypothetical protein